MRHPVRLRIVLTVTVALVSHAAVAAPSPGADAAFLDAVTWGVSPSSYADLRAKGRERWLKGQLHPPPTARLPAAVQDQVDALQPSGALYDRVLAFDAQAKAANALPDADAKAQARQAYQADLNASVRNAAGQTILRALYAPDQVRERMTWFWFNRFNVHQGKAQLRAMVGDYLDHAIRPHALGRFRDLLEATVRHPAMLRYLDNTDNAAGHINENYAREIMELHTMGVGSGYTQGDVEQLARILTGIGIDPRPADPKVRPERQAEFFRAGLVTFNPNRHDYADKTLLGHPIRGSGWAEVEQALDLLSRHPATAHNVSRAIATAFMGEPVSNDLVETLAAAFIRSDGDIAAVLNTLFHAPAFTASLGTAFKDPARYVLSALRLSYDERVILNAGPVQNWLNRLGEGLFNRTTPDGYPLAAAAWSGPGQMTTRFEIARQIGSGPAGLFKLPVQDATEEPAFPLPRNGLFFSVLSGSLSEPTRAALARAISPQDWNTLFLSCPEFMQGAWARPNETGGVQ